MIDLAAKTRDLATYALIAAFLAFINPYGATGGMSYPFALLYWFGMIFAGGISAELWMALYKRLRPDGPVWIMLIVAALTSALAVSGFIIVTEALFNDGVPLRIWPRLFGLVLVIATAVTLVSYTVQQAFDKTPPAAAPETGPKTDPTQTFLQRLPVKFRTATLYAIASEDHYLRIYTSLGEDLILMRLADAERELTGADGLRVHRSWWIARAGVSDERKDSGRSFLILPSGTEVPVSRSYRPKAKEAGFIS